MTPDPRPSGSAYAPSERVPNRHTKILMVGFSLVEIEGVGYKHNYATKWSAI